MTGSWQISIDEFRYSPASEPVLADLSFTITAGAIHHIYGPSGCGKSTLLAILSGHLPAPDSAAVLKGNLGGFPCHQTMRTTQDPSMQIAAATVIDELLLSPEYREATAEAALAKALASSDQFSIDHLLEKDTAHLSFGQLRLLGLTGVWQYTPDLLLLDEPFIGLDTRRFKQVHDAIDLIARNGCTVILTHTRALASEVAIELQPISRQPVPEPPQFTASAAVQPLSGAELRFPCWTGRSALNFHVEPGKLLLVTGPNGAGKTQLLQRLNGIAAFSSGTISRPARIAYVPQNPDQEIFAPGIIEETMVGAINPVAESHAFCGYFGLDSHLTRSPLLLSYGQKKRVSLIGAFMRRPECLLLDEPLSGLDLPNQQRLLKVLHAFLQRGGIAVAATHEPETFAHFKPATLDLNPEI